MNANDIIVKVQKLMTLAADPAAAPGESRNALALAQKLMLQHRVTEADVAAAARAARGLGAYTVDDMSTMLWGDCLQRQYGWLAMAVGHVVGCGVYSSWREVAAKKTARNYWGTKHVKTMVAYGLPADLAVGKALFEAVVRDMENALSTWRGGHPDCTRRSVRAQSFADGFAIALLERARASAEAAAKDTTPVAVPTDDGERQLMIVPAEESAQRERLLVAKAKKLGLGKARARSVRRDHDAAEAGARAASRVSLGRGGIS